MNDGDILCVIYPHPNTVPHISEAHDKFVRAVLSGEIVAPPPGDVTAYQYSKELVAFKKKKLVEFGAEL